MKIIQMRGLPGSGKSTWAKTLVDKDKTFKRVNRDDLRGMIDHGFWSQSTEKHIIDIEQMIAEHYITAGFNLVVDDTGLSESQVKIWREFADKHSAKLEIKFMDTPLEECITRDNKRANGVGEKVLRRFHNDFFASAPTVYEPPAGKPHAIICDIDGTLAHATNRGPYDPTKYADDAVDTEIRSIVKRYCNRSGIAPCRVIIVSGRDDTYQAVTEKWLKDNDVPYDAIYMRPAGDRRKDSIVKREIFDEHIRDNFRVKLVLDDRNQVVEMWRGLGLKVLQVQDGDF